MRGRARHLKPKTLFRPFFSASKCFRKNNRSRSVLVSLFIGAVLWFLLFYSVTSKVPTTTVTPSLPPKSTELVIAEDTKGLFRLPDLCDANVKSSAGVHHSKNPFDAVSSYDGKTSVQVRFIVTESRSIDQLFLCLATARLAGVPVEVVGYGWKGDFNVIRRQELLHEYINAAKLNDDDVVVMMDSDILFTGVDLYAVMQEYVSFSPATPEDTDAWLRWKQEQLAPVLFGTENNCFRPDAVPDGHCRDHQLALEEVLKQWGERHNYTYIPSLKDNRRRNTNQFLNSGVVVGRVWALKMLTKPFYDVVANVPPYSGWRFWSEQSVYGNLWIGLRFWEATSDMLGDERRRSEKNMYGLIGGMLDLDYQNRFVASFHSGNLGGGWVEYTDGVQTAAYEEYRILVSNFSRHTIDNIHANRTIVQKSRSGAAMAMTFTRYTQHCDARLPERSFSVPISNATNPAFYHFPGPRKSERLENFTHLLPTVIVLDALPDELANTRRVFYEFPPMKVWRMKESSDNKLSVYEDKEYSLSADELCLFAHKKSS